MLQTQKEEVQATSPCHLTKTNFRIGYSKKCKKRSPAGEPIPPHAQGDPVCPEVTNTELSLVAPFGNPSAITTHSQRSSDMTRANQNMGEPAEKISPPRLCVRSSQTEQSNNNYVHFTKRTHIGMRRRRNTHSSRLTWVDRRLKEKLTLARQPSRPRKHGSFLLLLEQIRTQQAQNRHVRSRPCYKPRTRNYVP